MTGGLRLSGLLAHPDWAAVTTLGGPAPDGAGIERVVTVADLHADPGDARAALLTVAVSAPSRPGPPRCCSPGTIRCTRRAGCSPGGSGCRCSAPRTRWPPR
ncbi:hypothetical protein [Pseudonocardia sp. ICBG162]|uniref:hypothetical protein n=1 Tax=Pseudonocardia sp. ICBG162 TaxID=2846761 RepID=UPI001CF7185D|nr:hypothetical protein [Pseudonocardia sp. ICBG162]